MEMLWVFALIALSNAGLIGIKGNQEDTLLGKEIDEHGCRKSAGYTWCEALNRCHQPFIEKCQAKRAPSVLLGSARDGNGCVTGAGYTWCETTKKCHRVWEKPCPRAPSVLLGSARGANGCVTGAGYTWCETTKKCHRVWEKPCPTEAVIEEAPKQVISKPLPLRQPAKRTVLLKKSKEVKFSLHKSPAKMVKFMPITKKSKEVKFTLPKESIEVEFLPKKSKEVQFIPKKLSKEVIFMAPKKSEEVTFIAPKAKSIEVKLIKKQQKSIETQFVYKPTVLKSEEVKLIKKDEKIRVVDILMPMKKFNVPEQKPVEAKIIPAPQKKILLGEEKRYVPVEPVTNNVNVSFPKKEEKHGVFRTIWSAIGRFFNWW